MNSPTTDYPIHRRLLRRMLPVSIVARTALAIILLTLLFGALFSGAAAWFIHQGEVERLRARLDELVATVESTASVACFVNDTALAREIGRGLMSNEVVSAVQIRSRDRGSLYDEHRAELALDDPGTLTAGRKLHSPFNPEEIVGEVRLYSSKHTIQALAWHSTRMVLLALGFQLVLAALGVAWVVFHLITKPIKSISDELHRMEVRTGVHLKVPRGHRRDEIGRLVGDVNALIGELTHLIEAERRMRLEREISERRLASIFEKVDAGMFEADRNGRLQHWNPAFVRTLGLPGDPPLLQSLLGERGVEAEALIHSCLVQGKSCDVDLELPRANGSQWIEMSLTPLDEHTLQGVINDITERKHRELAAHDLASRDVLTGLLNRRGFEAALHSHFESGLPEPGLQLAVLGIDLDYFKQVNDTHGHEVGDLVLSNAAKIFERAVRRSDLVARYGGDEFKIALVGIDSVAKARGIAESIINEIMQPQPLGDGREVHIGASIGIAFIESDDGSPVDAQRRADRALYAAKQAGRCRAVLADPGSGTTANETSLDDSDSSGCAA